MHHPLILAKMDNPSNRELNDSLQTDKRNKDTTDLQPSNTVDCFYNQITHFQWLSHDIEVQIKTVAMEKAHLEALKTQHKNYSWHYEESILRKEALKSRLISLF